MVIYVRTIFQVSTYGGCGSPCDDECFRRAKIEHKFYLSFENSICEDYVSEKFFNALHDGLVPVYMGKAEVILGDYDSFISWAIVF